MKRFPISLSAGLLAISFCLPALARPSLGSDSPSCGEPKEDKKDKSAQPQCGEPKEDKDKKTSRAEPQCGGDKGDKKEDKGDKNPSSV